MRLASQRLFYLIVSKDSPFREDADKRNRYFSYTAAHPSAFLSLPFVLLGLSDGRAVKAKELEVLAESVRTENHRKRALEAQKGYVDYIRSPAVIFAKNFPRHLITTLRGLPTFATHDDKARDFLEWNTDGIDWDRVAEKVRQTVYLGPILSNLTPLVGLLGRWHASNSSRLCNTMARRKTPSICSFSVDRSRA